ncbi:MAG: apolipoprotein N-acyltransferase [Nitrospirota bacterium]
MSNISLFFLPLLSGILLALSFPEADISVLAWVALIPLLYSIRDKSPRQSFKEGFVAGIAFYALSLRWVLIVMRSYGGIGFFSSFFLLLALSAYLALYIGAFAWLYVKAREHAGTASVLLAPAFWVALEMLRNYLLSGFPWNLLGYSQHQNLPLIQIADIAGVYGVSALIVMTNAAISEFIAVMSYREYADYRKIVWPVAAVAVMAASAVYGHYRLANLPRPYDSMKVTVVQGDIDQFRKWDPAFQSEVFDVYKKLTSEAAVQKPDLIIWPETATPFYFQDRILGEELSDSVKKANTWLLTGSPSIEDHGSDSVEYNSAYLINPSGIETDRYDKMHLVPFGEYVPLKTLLPFVSKMVHGIGDFGKGRDYTVMRMSKGSFGTAICFEVIFPELVRQFVLGGANFLTSITNDAWFGNSGAPYQHFDMSVFRAVENRRAMVRAANTGISGVILPSGEVIATTSIFKRDTMTAEVPLMEEKTFYTLYGDIFGYFCSLITTCFIAIILYRRFLKR